MSVLAQTLLTLVRSHLVTLVLLTVWHIYLIFKRLFLYRCDENLGRLESRDVVCRNGHSGVPGDVPCSLLGPVLDDEAAESAEIYRLSLCERVLDAVHAGLEHGLDSRLLNACCFCNLVYYVCFSHNIIDLLESCLTLCSETQGVAKVMRFCEIAKLLCHYVFLFGGTEIAPYLARHFSGHSYDNLSHDGTAVPTV